MLERRGDASGWAHALRWVAGGFSHATPKVAARALISEAEIRAVRPHGAVMSKNVRRSQLTAGGESRMAGSRRVISKIKQLWANVKREIKKVKWERGNKRGGNFEPRKTKR